MLMQVGSDRRMLPFKDEGRLPSASTCTRELKLPQCTKVSRAPREAQDGDSLASCQCQGTGRQVRFKFNDAGAWPLAKESRGPSGSTPAGPPAFNLSGPVIRLSLSTRTGLACKAEDHTWADTVIAQWDDGCAGVQ
jgi:hypothetical protein